MDNSYARRRARFGGMPPPWPSDPSFSLDSLSDFDLDDTVVAHRHSLAGRAARLVGGSRVASFDDVDSSLRIRDRRGAVPDRLVPVSTAGAVDPGTVDVGEPYSLDPTMGNRSASRP